MDRSRKSKPNSEKNLKFPGMTQLSNILSSPATRLHLIAGKVVESDQVTQADLPSPGVQVVPHTMPVTESLAIGRGILCKIEPSRFLIKEKDVAMRRAAGRGSRADVVGNKGARNVELRRFGYLHSRLNPVQNRAKNAE